MNIVSYRRRGDLRIELTDDAGKNYHFLNAENAAYWMSIYATGGVAAPNFTVEADITGTEALGATLTCDNGTVTGTPGPTITKQWKRNGTNIGGATGNTYLLVAGDVGTVISCLVTAANASGSDTSTPTTGVITGTGTIAAQNMEIGGKSLVSAGDWRPLDSNSVEVAVTSIASQTGCTRTWSVVSGRIVASGTPDVDHNKVLSVVTALGTVNVTIKSSGTDANGNNLAVSYSVFDMAELKAALQHTALAFGDNVLLRTGAGPYNPLQDQAIQRPQNLVGTWVPPSLYNAAMPAKGYDLNTGNFVTVTKHVGASPVIAKMRFLGNQGTPTQEAQYTRLKGLTFVYPPLVAVTGATYTQNAIALDNGARMVAIDGCDISSEANPALAEQLQGYSGIGINNGDAWVQDNVVHDCISGIQSTFGSNVQVVGNTIFRWYADGMQLKFSNNCNVSFNIFHSMRDLDQTPGAPGEGLHPDAMQFHDLTPANTGLTCIGNIQRIGDKVLSGNSGSQGIFGAANSTGAIVAGNLLVMGNYANVLRLAYLTSSYVHNNTAVKDPTADALLGIGFDEGNGVMCKYNVCNRVYEVAPVVPTVFANNVEVQPAAYGTIFVDPQSGTAITDINAQYDIKPGVYATGTSNVIPGANSTYINHDTRTYDFPWMESGFNAAGVFTDVTGAAVSTLFTSNEVTISGVSATGALVTVSSGTFRVRDGANALIRDYSSQPYVVPNGYKITLQNTSPAAGNTPLNTAVTIGSSTDTWTITTAASGSAWVTVFDRTAAFASGTTEPGWVNYTFVQMIPITAFSQTSGSKMKLTLEGAATEGMICSAMWVGEAGGADPYDFTGTPVQVTMVGGSTTITVGAGATVVTEEITFAKNGTNNLLVAMQFQNGAADNTKKITAVNGPSGHGCWAGTGQVAGTVDKPSGWGAQTSSGFHAISKIELFI